MVNGAFRASLSLAKEQLHLVHSSKPPQKLYDISETDQFTIRFVRGVLSSELIVRIAGGFATTVREDDEHVARQKRDLEKLTVN